jgi:transposase, IS30 family
MKYCQLTEVERYTLSALRQQGFSQRQIARMMERSPSTICRELQRNRCHQTNGAYRPSKAEERTRGRRARCRRGSHYDAAAYAKVQACLSEQQWSPEQIAQVLRQRGECGISHQTIYRYIRRDWRDGGQLYRHLRQHYRRRKRHYGLEKRGRKQGKRSIEQRPPEVEARQQIGHAEIDTVMGASHETACIVTVVERATGHVAIGKLEDRTVASLNQRLIWLLARSPFAYRTLTSDNGTEFHGYEAIEARTGVTIYFARPHHPWERGSNENLNGLIRQYLPKGKSMASLTQKQCDAIAYKLNTRPRKRYDYRNPLQMVALRA